MRPEPSPAEPLWTLHEVATYLKVHPKTVRRWLKCRALPCVRVGTRIRFDPSDVALWVSARKEGASCRGS